MSNTIFYKNKTKIWLFILGLIFTIVVAIILASNSKKFVSSHIYYRSWIAIFIMAVLGGILSFIYLIIFLGKAITNNVGFVISKEGIHDLVGVTNPPLILWKDIKKIDVTSKKNDQHLKVILRKPDAYIQRRKGFFKALAYYYYKIYGSPILLHHAFLKCTFEEFKTEIYKGMGTIGKI